MALGFFVGYFFVGLLIYFFSAFLTPFLADLGDIWEPMELYRVPEGILQP